MNENKVLGALAGDMVVLRGGGEEISIVQSSGPSHFLFLLPVALFPWVSSSLSLSHPWLHLKCYLLRKAFLDHQHSPYIQKLLLSHYLISTISSFYCDLDLYRLLLLFCVSH